jgi:RNA polymerase sigma-70 factor (ECF subfamily)
MGAQDTRDDNPMTGNGFLDQQDFEEFYRRTAPALLSYVRRVTGNFHSAEDILQSAYIRLLNAPAMPEAGRKAYLYTIATNLFKDEWRRQARERRWWQFNPLSEHYHPDPGLSLDMAQLLKSLKPRERALLWLAYGEGFDHREIAGILKVSERSVRVMLHRVRNKARTLLTHAGRPAMVKS